VAPGLGGRVFSISVFEHLVYPWKASLEINRVLKPGGLVFISTHPAWPAHELPWDFWRFPVAGLAHLFDPDTGFELVTRARGLPAKIYSLVERPATRGLRAFHVNLGVAVIGRKVRRLRPDKLRWDIDYPLGATSEYPRPG
jgi:SAM-dependent methyltransferase